MANVLITGASTGIGNLTARSVREAGHTVFASMRDPEGKNAEHARALREMSIRVLELDVQSDASVDNAISGLLESEGTIDVVVHNAGHLAFGYAEAFTPADLERVFDINVLGMQRLNRAVLPHMRTRREGTLIYISSTSFVSMPPFLAPYVATKAAFDALAAATALEIGRFGIETVIVQPGAFTRGTMHFAHASRASDSAVSLAYGALNDLLNASGPAHERLFADGVDADPKNVAAEIARLLSLPRGKRPKRSVVDFTGGRVKEIVDALLDEQQDFLKRMDLGQLSEVNLITM